MGSNTTPPKTWVETPCIRSAALSRAAGCNIYLKLETLQPSGSFKSRGIGNMMSTAILQHGSSKPIHFYCSSGGNAGLACVTAANILDQPATIVVPTLVSALMIQKLRLLSADVVQIGKDWSEADAHLREVLLANDPNGVYVHPFDHADVWAGHSSMIDELELQMQEQDGYDAVVCSVGGGGLFCGIMQGLERNGHLRDPGPSCNGFKVLAMETIGAESLNASLKAGKLIRIPAITSIATSLGATLVAEAAFTWSKRPEVVSQTVTDAEAAMACVHFADQERIIVESACGATVATAYNGMLHSVLFPHLSKEEFARKKVVLIVCGGSNITLEILEKYKREYGGQDILGSR